MLFEAERIPTEESPQGNPEKEEWEDVTIRFLQPKSLLMSEYTYKPKLSIAIERESVPQGSRLAADWQFVRAVEWLESNPSKGDQERRVMVHATRAERERYKGKYPELFEAPNEWVEVPE